MIAAGVMSGTSADGVDAVLLELRSVSKRHTPRVLGQVHRAYPPALRKELTRPQELTVKRLAELSFVLAARYESAVRALFAFGMPAVVGMHGQTVWHAPPPARLACTLQIGSSSALAVRLGVPVVGDLRSADLALGGQGAPIVPFSHWFFTHERETPRLVVNFGGICNFTYVTRRAEDVVAYDTGPGMMLSDAFARAATGGRLACDRDGTLSREGKVVTAVVDDILAHPFIKKRPPKSTGREDFGSHFVEPLLRKHRRVARADMARSLLAGSARALALAVGRDPRIDGHLKEIVVSGGGAENPVLVEEVAKCFPDVDISVERAGVLAPSCHEPAAMALIAARTFSRLPSSLPGVTGAKRPAILGHVVFPDDVGYASRK